MALEPAVQDLVDKAAIRDLMARYARGIDRRDWDLIASTFATDAYVDYVEWEGRGFEEILRGLKWGIARTERSTHFMGDQEVRLNGDTAEVETYAVAYLVRTVDETQSLLMRGLRYQDKMVRQKGQWLVQHRLLHFDWLGNAAVDISVPSAQRVQPSQ